MQFKVSARMLAACLLLLHVFSLNSSAIDIYRQGQRALEKRTETGNREAVVLFQEALDENPYYFQAWRNLGLAYQRLSMPVEAEAAFAKALKQQPGHLQTNLHYARTLITLNKLKEARTHIQKVLAKEPRNTRALYTRALYHYKNGRPDQAMDSLTAALKIVPGYFRALLLKAKIHEERGERSRAEKALQQAWRRASRSNATNLALGRFYLRNGRVEEARSYVERVRNRDPENQEALDLLGRIYVYTERWPQAASVYKKLSRQSNTDPFLHYSLAVASRHSYEQNKNRNMQQQALQAYERALELRFNDEVFRRSYEMFSREAFPVKSKRRKKLADYHIQKGDLYMRYNQRHAAAVAYKRAIRLHPVSIEARSKLAKIHKLRGELEKYYNALKIIHELDRNNVRVRDSLEFLEKRIERLPSRQAGLKQYEVRNSLPRLVVFPLFEEYNKRSPYFEMEEILAGFLEDALLPSRKLKLIIAEDAVPNLVSARQKARSLKADYFVHGRYIKSRDQIVQEIFVRHTKSGEIQKKYRVSERGNRQLFRSALNLSEKLRSELPLSGQIIRKTRDKVIINLGRIHNVKKGDRFRIYRDPAFRRKFLASYGTATNLPASGILTIQQADEAVAFGDIVERKIFDGIASYQHVVKIPPAKEDNAEGAGEE